MKEFNLERALAGEPVITRNGKKVTELHLFKGGNLIHPLLGTLEGEEGYFCWSKDGLYNYPKGETSWDLFMVEQKKSIWVNLCEYDNGQLWIGCYFNSLEEANKHRTHLGRYIKTIEITNER